MNKLTPSFYLQLEKNNGGRILILYGKKMPLKKTSYYMICLEKNKTKPTERDSDNCLGKLRAQTSENDRFVLYDNGENPSQKGSQYKNVRKEHGAFIYRYEPCNVGNIRKMTIVFPAIHCININPHKKYGMDAMTNDPKDGYVMAQNAPQQTESQYLPDERQDMDDQSSSQVAPSQYVKGLGVKGTRDKYGREIPDQSKYLYQFVDWRPVAEQETLLNSYLSGRGKNAKYRTFVDNPPQWNPKTNTYVYDFKGRVTEPSIKNFQLIPEVDGKRGDTLSDFVLQFGKRDKDEFILDVQFPLSIFQGFGLALSAFDTD